MPVRRFEPMHGIGCRHEGRCRRHRGGGCASARRRKRHDLRERGAGGEREIHIRPFRRGAWHGRRERQRAGRPATPERLGTTSPQARREAPAITMLPQYLGMSDGGGRVSVVAGVRASVADPVRLATQSFDPNARLRAALTSGPAVDAEGGRAPAQRPRRVRDPHDCFVDDARHDRRERQRAHRSARPDDRARRISEHGAQRRRPRCCRSSVCSKKGSGCAQAQRVCHVVGSARRSAANCRRWAARLHRRRCRQSCRELDGVADATVRARSRRQRRAWSPRAPASVATDDSGEGGAASEHVAASVSERDDQRSRKGRASRGPRAARGPRDGAAPR